MDLLHWRVYLARFEKELAELCGTRHAIAVSNGTVALHVALIALALGPGDEVIVPSLTYIASVNVIRYVGATPVFVDVDPTNWCLDVSAVEAAVTSRTKAVIAVHLYGQPTDMDALGAVCTPRGIRIVEDVADAPLANYHGRPTGGLDDVGTFSFFGNKLFTSDEGGAVTIDDDDLAARIRLLSDQGHGPEAALQLSDRWVQLSAHQCRSGAGPAVYLVRKVLRQGIAAKGVS